MRRQLEVVGRVPLEVSGVALATGQTREEPDTQGTTGDPGWEVALHVADVPVTHQLHGGRTAVHQRVGEPGGPVDLVITLLESTVLHQRLNIGERLDYGGVGPGAFLPGLYVEENLGASDAVREVLRYIRPSHIPKLPRAMVVTSFLARVLTSANS